MENKNDPDPCHKKPILSTVYYPDGIVKTDSPIYGVLTQPYHNYDDAVDFFTNDITDMYISASHVKFLEAAGARIVPVSFRLRDYALYKLLA